MTTARDTSTVTRYFVHTDKSAFWCSGETYDEAVKEFHDSIAGFQQIAANGPSSTPPEEWSERVMATVPTRITGVVRRSEVTTRETTEEQLPYSPEDQQ